METEREGELGTSRERDGTLERVRHDRDLATCQRTFGESTRSTETQQRRLQHDSAASVRAHQLVGEQRIDQ